MNGQRPAPLHGPATSVRVAGGRGVLLLAVCMVLAVAALAGCGGASSMGAGSSARTSANPSLGKVTTGPDGVQQVTLQTEDDYRFTPDHFTVKPGQVRLTVDNVATQMTHNFRFRPNTGPAAISARIPILSPGQKQTITFTVQTPGDYPFECSFHVQLGQVGTMTVQP